MIYSIGKELGGETHLARKAFLPGQAPFRCLNIDTTGSQEMISFRDKFTKEHGPI